MSRKAGYKLDADGLAALHKLPPKTRAQKVARDRDDLAIVLSLHLADASRRQMGTGSQFQQRPHV